MLSYSSKFRGNTFHQEGLERQRVNEVEENSDSTVVPFTCERCVTDMASVYIVKKKTLLWNYKARYSVNSQT